VTPRPPPPRSALFCTWNKSTRLGEPRLRGCIGTLEPRSLRSALPEYALTSALRDRRFPPVALAELPYLHCTVSLLHSFEAGAGWDDWEVGTHGIIINFSDAGVKRSATFLPEVAAHAGWDRAATLEQLVRKAGCAGGASPRLRAAVRLTRYQSTTCTLSYEEYQRLKDPALYRLPKPDKGHTVEDAIPVPA
jgi:uncharacterized protein (TIGR00296 family)